MVCAAKFVAPVNGYLKLVLLHCGYIPRPAHSSTLARNQIMSRLIGLIISVLFFSVLLVACSTWTMAQGREPIVGSGAAQNALLAERLVEPATDVIAASPPLAQAAVTSLVAQPVSPLAVEGSVRFQGPSAYDRGHPDFVLWYDPAIWQFVTDDDGGNRLVAQTDEACVFSLNAGSGFGATQLATVQIADREWKIYSSSEGVIYSIDWGNAAYLFSVKLPQPYAVDVRQPCQQLVETMLESFAVHETVELTVEPSFVVTFSTQDWKLDPNPPDRLLSATLPGCELLLDMKPYLARTQLAKPWTALLLWANSPLSTQGSFVLFSTVAGNSVAFFHLALPTDIALAGQCQVKAEAVLETLHILPVDSTSEQAAWE
jgi:hypothetical protein